jgi:hypothetical protein
MKKTFILSAVAVTMGLCAMNASALPNGWESANVLATLNFQNYSSAKGDFITKVSVSNKDVLFLINAEFGTVPSSGAKLVTYGLDSEEFAVLDKNNNTVISDASYNSPASDDYELYFNPDNSGYYTKTYVPNKGDTWNYQCGQGALIYEDATDSNYFTLSGYTKWTDNFDPENESYSMSNATGYFYLPIANKGYYNSYGVITGGISGSGNGVDTW